MILAFQRTCSCSEVVIATEPVLEPQHSDRMPGLPETMEPMLATLVKEAPAGDAWVHEMKLDGYRVVARVDRGKVRLITRNGNDWTARYPAVAGALADWRSTRALLDGEIAILLPDGTTSFQALQNLDTAPSGSVLTYFVFDVLHLDGEDLTKLPLLERKARLEALLRETGVSGSERIRMSDHVRGRGPDFFREACALGLEGIISKRAESVYHPGRRSPEWVKVKCVRRQEFVIAGYTEPSGSRSGFGSLLLGYYDDGDLIYAGRVGTGFTGRKIDELMRRLRPLRVSRPPFASKPAFRTRTPVHWVQPELVAEVSFTEWTDDGILRHPSFQALREDKPPRAVVREARSASAKPATPGSRKSRTAEPSGGAAVAGIKVTSRDRIVYPGAGITKGEVIDYYEQIAPMLLPHLCDRPLTLLRCPDGVPGECFFQKHGGEGTPDVVPRVNVKGEDTDEEPYVYIDALPAVIALVQLNVLEFHVWNSRVQHLEHPDQLVFDLDPGEGLPFERVVEAARDVRHRLTDLGLEPFLKTTGGKGLHVVTPLKPAHEWKIVTAFAKLCARTLAREMPDRYTDSIAKRQRKGRIFIDYLRNGRNANQIAAYSTRARPGATVSVPLRWDELRPSLDPSRYDVRSVLRRVRSLNADPWEEFEAARREITPEMVSALDRAQARARGG